LKKIILLIGNGSQFKVARSLINSDLYKISNLKINLRNDIVTEQNNVYLKYFFKKQISKKIFIFIAIGSNYHRKIISKFLDLNFKDKFSYISIISNQSNVSSNVKIGKGTIIMPGVTINTDTIIGKHCIINTNSSVDHDNRIGSFSSLGPGTNTGGNVIIGSNTHIGIGSSIKNNITIKNNVVVGGGSFVNKFCNSNSLYYGVPTKFIKKRKLKDTYL
jgi:sugar O-acyltransferase (sialic acid O-acetyltransferase NeuD family)